MRSKICRFNSDGDKSFGSDAMITSRAAMNIEAAA